MDDNEFKNKLSKIAKWYIPIVSEGRGCKGHLRKPMPDSETNETFGPVIEELIPQLKPCEWCGVVCNQKQNHTMRFMSIDGKRPKRRWDHSCQNCRRHWDSKTGKLKENKNAKPRANASEAEKKKYWWNEGVDTTPQTLPKDNQ